MSKYDADAAGKKRIKIQRPAIQSLEEEKMWREVAKFAELIPSEPDPNFGRLDEIKEEIKKGTYLTPQVIEETAARLAIRFTQRE
jgi:hypothetical protein